MSHQNKWGKIKEDSEKEAVQEATASESSMETEAHDEDLREDFQEDCELEHLDYEALEEKLTLSEQKAHENWEKLVRMTAEMDNVRRRAEKDVEQARRFGVEKLITALLPVLDSLEQASQLVDEKTNPAMSEGLKLTIKLFLDILLKHEVSQIDPVGEPFNPQEHEVMSMAESADLPANSVLTVFQKGYRLSTRVIRPARVIVVK